MQDNQSNSQNFENAPPSNLIKLFIKPDGLETKTQTEIDPATGKEIRKHYIDGSINGEAFQVICNEPVEVSPEIAELLFRLIEKQKR